MGGRREGGRAQRTEHRTADGSKASRSPYEFISCAGGRRGGPRGLPPPSPRGHAPPLPPRPPALPHPRLSHILPRGEEALEARAGAGAGARRAMPGWAGPNKAHYKGKPGWRLSLSISLGRRSGCCRQVIQSRRLPQRPGTRRPPHRARLGSDASLAGLNGPGPDPAWEAAAVAGRGRERPPPPSRIPFREHTPPPPPPPVLGPGPLPSRRPPRRVSRCGCGGGGGKGRGEAFHSPPGAGGRAHTAG